jgi:hypothetical protein
LHYRRGAKLELSWRAKLELERPLFLPLLLALLQLSLPLLLRLFLL